MNFSDTCPDFWKRFDKTKIERNETMEKMRMTLTALLLVAATLFSLFATGCAAGGKKAISYKDEVISTAVFQYLCSQKKTDYLYEAYGVDKSAMSSSQLQDNPTIWRATSADGATVGDTLKSEVLDEAKLFLYMSNYAKSKGYTLGPDEKNLVKREFDKLVSNYGDKKTFNREMKKYGVGYDEMLEYNYLQTLAYQGINLLFGENGTQRVSEENLEKYYKANYATAACIFINTKNKTYSNGKVVGMPEEERKEKLALADDLYEKIQAGEDFAELALKHSDQAIDEASAKKGYTFAKGGFVNAQAEEKVWTMKNGEFARVDTDGGVYLLYRKPLNTDAYERVKETIRAQLEEVKKYALVSEVEKEFKINEDFLNELNIQEIPHVV